MTYFLEWAGLLIVPAVLAFLCAPWLVLIALIVALIVLAIVVAALVALLVASPYLIARMIRGRWLDMRSPATLATKDRPWTSSSSALSR